MPYIMGIFVPIRLEIGPIEGLVPERVPHITLLYLGERAPTLGPVPLKCFVVRVTRRLAALPPHRPRAIAQLVEGREIYALREYLVSRYGGRERWGDFVPHVTVARIRAKHPDIGAYLEYVRPHVAEVEVDVDSVSLIDVKGGSYVEVDRAPLDC